MMNKFLLTLLACLAGVTGVSAETIRYRGYVEEHDGYMWMNNDSKTDGFSWGASTSHGILIGNNVFVGLGVEFTQTGYSQRYTLNGNPADALYIDVQDGLFVTGFADARYIFLPQKRVHPYLGLKAGAGYQDISKKAIGYVSPAVGVTVNFFESFGLDASLSYSFHGSKKENAHGSLVPANSFNAIYLTLGLHF